MSRQAESAFKGKLCTRLAAEAGGWWLPVEANARQAAAVDILGCYRGIFVAFETKMKRRKATARQGVILGLVREAGGVAAVARSFEEAAAVLHSIDDALARAATPLLQADGFADNTIGRHLAAALAAAQ